MAERMSASTNDPFYGNSPADVWDEGYEAALAGRSRDSNPFRTGEAELLDRIGKLDQLGKEGVLGTERGSTPGSSATQVSREELEEFRRQQGEANPF